MRAAIALVAGLALAAAAQAEVRQWRYAVLLDGRPIGTHEYTRSANADGGATLTSRAEMTVRLLGLVVYRYRHEATETWLGGCLVALDASTDDDGKPSRVRAGRDGSRLRIESGGTVAESDGCTMSYAYWDPAMLRQTRLLNAQTGRLDPVRIESIGPGRVDIDGRAVDATRWRLSGPAEPLDLWYAADGAWLGLDATVRGGRHLAYRWKDAP